MLFVHGFGLDARMWQPQIEALADKHRTIAVTLPGFGPNPTTSSDGVSAARAILEVLDSLNVERAHVVGHALGGAVAADFALAFPHRVRTLVLVAALLRGRNSGIASWTPAATLAREGNMTAAAKTWLADPLFASAMANPDLAPQLREFASDYGGAHWRDEITTTFESADPPGERLASITAPTLVVVGTEDLPTFRAMADEYATTVPRARKVELSGAGHMASLEASPAFNAALRNFFDA